MRRHVLFFLAACLAAPVFVSAGCSSAKVAEPEDGAVPVADGDTADADTAPDGGPDVDGGPIDVDLGEPDLGPIDAGPSNVCGDGVLAAPEQCDDGNTTAGDGCDASCNVESDVCPGGAAPRELTSGSTVSGDTSGTMSAASGSCGGGTAGENTFFFTIYEPSDVTLTTDFPETAYNAAIYVRSDCASRASELGCESAAPEGDTLTLASLPPGTYFAFVDGAGGESGAYELGLTVTPRIAVGGACDPMGATGLCVEGAECTADAMGRFACRTPESICLDAARTLTLGAAPTGGTTVGGENRYAPSCSRDGDSPERVFRVTVPAGNHDLVVTVAPTNYAADNFDPVLTVETTCGEVASAVDCADANTEAPEEVVIPNAAGEYFILVDGFGDRPGDVLEGEFEVSARLRDIVASGGACDPAGVDNRCEDGFACEGDAGAATCVDPAAAICATAEAATLGTAVTATLGGAGAVSDLAPGCAMDAGFDEDLYFVDLTAPAVITARARGTLDGRSTIYIRGADACGSGAELECDTTGGMRLEVTTEEVPAGRYYVVVDASGTYNVTINVITTVAAGGTCDATSTTTRCATGTACIGGTCSAVTVINDAAPNASFCDAQGPSTGDTLFVGELSVGGATDLDTFEVRLAAPARLAISTSNGAGGCTADTIVEVFSGVSSTCAELDMSMPMPIASDDDSGLAMLCSELTTDVLPAGSYYIRVRRAGGGPGGSYQVLVDVQ
jgi:cysteine-rich repeat protein